jgi:glycosyltransferase involved in cell wall biosynthesis
MKISILLPYKENYSPTYPGAVSLFVHATSKISIYKKDIVIFGSTNLIKKLSKNYVNIPLKRQLFKSQSKDYVNKFVLLNNEKKPDIVEIHNRPNYVKFIKKLNTKIILYFHNDPISMIGSKLPSERKDLLSQCSKIIFNSEWSKKRFLKNFNNFFHKSLKLEVIHQSINKTKVDIKKKEKLITFVGKLNSAKGYDLFGKSIIKILNQYPKWKSVVIGDEPREEITFKHKNLKNLGFQHHNKVLDIFKKSSIAVACSRWEEPFGRTSLEASSRGCAVIISNRGGLPETITNGVIIRNLTAENVYKSIKNLIINKNQRLILQKASLKNFYLTDKYITNKIDNYRTKLSKNDLINQSQRPISVDKLKILHVTNFNERHNGRLFYNTGKRINNGLIRLNHSVLDFSDRDIVSYYRSLNDVNGSKKLNSKLIEVISNYVPNILILGHADLIKKETLIYIKKNYPQIKIVQWFLDRMDSNWLVNRKRFLDKIEIMDASFCTTDPSALKFSSKQNIFYIPNPVDESFESLHNYKHENFNNDVFFAMSHGVHRGILKRGKFDPRENFINKLIKKIPNIRFDLYGMHEKQPVWADNFINVISQSKIGLNLSQGKTAKYYSSDRFAQLVGNGLMVMIDEKTQFNDFFDNDEIITYNNINDLSEKIIKYSHDDKLRKKIAKNGRDKYFKYFNSTIIADFIIKKAFNINHKKFYWE